MLDQKPVYPFGALCPPQRTLSYIPYHQNYYIVAIKTQCPSERTLLELFFLGFNFPSSFHKEHSYLKMADSGASASGLRSSGKSLIFSFIAVHPYFLWFAF
jgi:hypothetical protein